MKTFVKGGLLVLALAGAFVVSTPARIEALTCPTGSNQGHIRLYYSDATYTTIICRGSDCGGEDPCEGASPYYTETTICCRPRG